MSDIPKIEEAVEFAENPEPRCPCILLLDTSGSMSGPPIEALNEGLKAFKNDIVKESNEFLSNMKAYGLNGICITSFDLSPIIVFGKKYKLEDVDIILRNIGIFPEISPFEWIYRQSNILNEQIWVYIIKSGVGPMVNGLFEPYFYLLFADPQSYLGEFPAKLTARFNQIIG